MSICLLFPGILCAVWIDVACAAIQSTDMKDAQKQDTAAGDEPASVEMKTDAKSESDNKEGVTKMDTIPASVAVTTSEPSAEHWHLDWDMVLTCLLQ